jgi:hypothetical protein
VITPEELEEVRQVRHAALYPSGCGQLWRDCCEDCAERLGGDPPGPVFFLRRVGGTAADADLFGAYLMTNLMPAEVAHCVRDTPHEAYCVAQFMNSYTEVD